MEQYQSSILIIFAHPALQKSRVNKQLIRYVSDIDGVTFHDLYEAYPDFHIHVKHEQELLMKHDVIIFHHPLFWFSAPAILKEWMDLVLQHGWAYGKNGRALKGKTLLTVTSTGGRESLFHKNSYNRNTMIEFLAPFRQTAYICGMDYLPPFVVHGTHTITQEEIAAHGKDYQKLITAIRDGKFDIEAAVGLQRLNTDTDSIIKGQKQ